MRRCQTTAISLAIMLIVSNGAWLVRFYDSYGVASEHGAWEQRIATKALKSAIALIPLIADGHPQKTAILNNLMIINPGEIPQKSGDTVVIGGLVLSFTPDGQFVGARQAHSACC
jgi:hypothetical protein